jgi:hypothetical protein
VNCSVAFSLQIKGTDMTRDDILRMAREAGFAGWLAETPFVTTCFEHFAALVAAAEREACARVCEARHMGDNNREDAEARRCAAAIRARGG